MSSDARKRQKKQERKAAKRKEKKHELVRQKSLGLADRLSAAARYPVLHCLVTDSIEPQGLGQVMLSREFPNGQVAVATFLVDRYCLGVKDVHAEILGRSAYESKYVRRLRSDMPSHAVSPADVCKLVTQAVAYAHGLGLSPHPDYPKAALLLAGIDPAASSAEFEFGKDGKPFFIAGPHDTPERCRRILAILDNTCGPGGYHFLQPVGPADFEGRELIDEDESGEFLDEIEDAGEDEA
jgi:hypothetical protein